MHRTKRTPSTKHWIVQIHCQVYIRVNPAKQHSLNLQEGNTRRAHLYTKSCPAHSRFLWFLEPDAVMHRTKRTPSTKHWIVQIHCQVYIRVNPAKQHSLNLQEGNTRRAHLYTESCPADSRFLWFLEPDAAMHRTKRRRGRWISCSHIDYHRQLRDGDDYLCQHIRDVPGYWAYPIHNLFRTLGTTRLQKSEPLWTYSCLVVRLALRTSGPSCHLNITSVLCKELRDTVFIQKRT
jgi:hypothetical protein